MDATSVEVSQAAEVILEILPAEGAKPDELVAAFEKRDPKISRDIVRGAIWSLLNDGVLETTLQGTLQRRNVKRRST